MWLEKELSRIYSSGIDNNKIDVIIDFQALLIEFNSFVEYITKKDFHNFLSKDINNTKLVNNISLLSLENSYNLLKSFYKQKCCLISLVLPERLL